MYAQHLFNTFMFFIHGRYRVSYKQLHSISKKITLVLDKNYTKTWISSRELVISCFRKIKKDVFISSFQIIIFQINITESTSRSRISPKSQKDVVMKSRSRSPMNVDTKNAKLKNATKKINLSNIKKDKIKLLWIL